MTLTDVTTWTDRTGSGYIRMNYDDTVTPNVAIDFPYFNGSQYPYQIMVYDKQGRLIEETRGSGYTHLMAPGESGTYPAGNNWDLRADGSVNGWTVTSRGPVR